MKMFRKLLFAGVATFLPTAIAHAHGGAGHAEHSAAEMAMTPAPANAGEERWLAGDHHVHSRYSVGYDERHNPPAPIVGGDAIYPIPMNAMMGRKFGLSWMVATDHGGPNHSKINHDRAYPELVLSRELVPEVVQFFGLELNTPGADHSSVIVPQGGQEADRLRSVEAAYDAKEAFPVDPARDAEPKMIEALRTMRKFEPKPVVIAHHPSRSAQGLGAYGKTSPAELRAWNDTAPDIALGMEGAPGHQAATMARGRPADDRLGDQIREDRPRGSYRNHPTYGGFDQMTAVLGGFWDSMLGEGRRWWVTANSDSHVHWTEGGADFWPGEYSKTYVFAAKDPGQILERLRAGQMFVVTGDLVDSLSIDAATASGTHRAAIGGTVSGQPGERIRLKIRFRDPETLNAHGDNPVVRRVDLIRGSVTGGTPDPTSGRNSTTRVEKRFTAADWTKIGDHYQIDYTLEPLAGREYIRLRGTNRLDELEPAADTMDEPVWQDLWFYSNPVFIEPEG